MSPKGKEPVTTTPSRVPARYTDSKGIPTGNIVWIQESTTFDGYVKVFVDETSHEFKMESIYRFKLVVED